MQSVSNIKGTISQDTRQDSVFTRASHGKHYGDPAAELFRLHYKFGHDIFCPLWSMVPTGSLPQILADCPLPWCSHSLLDYVRRRPAQCISRATYRSITKRQSAGRKLDSSLHQRAKIHTSELWPSWRATALDRRARKGRETRTTTIRDEFNIDTQLIASIQEWGLGVEMFVRGRYLL
jgi:hypothetical protein